MDKKKNIKVVKKETKIFNTRLAQRDVDVLEGLVELYGLESKADALRICIRIVDDLGKDVHIKEIRDAQYYRNETIERMLDSENRLINRYEGERTIKG